MQISETYTVKIDSKGRLTFPSGMRRVFEEVMHEGFYLKRSVHEDCLELYTARSWARELEKLDQLNRYVKEHNRFIRRFIAGVKFASADALGRINIPCELSRFAGLKKEVTLSPSGNSIEIWDKERYERSIEMSEEEYSAWAEKLLGEVSPKQ